MAPQLWIPGAQLFPWSCIHSRLTCSTSPRHSCSTPLCYWTNVLHAVIAIFLKKILHPAVFYRDYASFWKFHFSYLVHYWYSFTCKLYFWCVEHTLTTYWIHASILGTIWAGRRLFSLSSSVASRSSWKRVVPTGFFGPLCSGGTAWDGAGRSPVLSSFVWSWPFWTWASFINNQPEYCKAPIHTIKRANHCHP